LTASHLVKIQAKKWVFLLKKNLKTITENEAENAVAKLLDEVFAPKMEMVA